MEFTKNLIEELKQSKKTQKEIAKELHIRESNIANWKRGRLPSLEIFYKLCLILDASADELLGIKKIG